MENNSDINSSNTSSQYIPNLEEFPEPLKTFYREQGYNLTSGIYWQLEFDSEERDYYPYLVGYHLDGRIGHSIKLTGDYDIYDLNRQINSLYSKINRIVIDEREIKENSFSKDRLKLIERYSKTLGNYDIDRTPYLVNEIRRLTLLKDKFICRFVLCEGSEELKGYGYVELYDTILYSGKLLPKEAAEVFDIPIHESSVIVNRPIGYYIYLMDNQYLVAPKWPSNTEYGYLDNKLVEPTDYYDMKVCICNSYREGLILANSLNNTLKSTIKGTLNKAKDNFDLFIDSLIKDKFTL